MFRITSESELLESFRPLDRAEVELPASLRFPLGVRDYLTWSEPSGHRVFLLFSEPGRNQPLGIVFRREQSAGVASRMCEWCHAVRGGDGVTLLTAAASAHRRVGIQLCRDLSCKDKALETPGPDDLSGTSSGHEKIRQILRRMSVTARRSLY